MKTLKIIGSIFLVTIFVMIVKSSYLNYKITSPNQSQQPDKLIIGIWQDSPSMAAGWGDRYHFYPDGTYSFVIAQGNCASRVRQIDGNWIFLENSQISLSRNLVLEWENGQTIKTTSSDIGCGSPTKIVNYTEKIKEVDGCDTDICNTLKNGLSINFIEDDLGGYTRTKIDIAGTPYWKMENNPNITAQ